MEKLVSLIVPVLNAGRYIEQCLDAIVNLDYPKGQLEIIVVDNGSVDSTVQLVKKFPVQVLVKENCTVSALRNFGAKNAKGEILAFVDADCIVPKYWLKEAVELLQQEKVGAAGSWYDLPPNPSFIAKTWDVHMGNRRGKIGDIDWLPSGSLVMHRQVFEVINGFNESLITDEDVNICERIRKAGYTVFAHPKLSVIHLGNPRGINDFFLKEIWRGKGVLQNFLAGLPNLRFNMSIGFAFATLVFLVLGIIGVFLQRNLLIFVSLIGIISAPIILSARTMLINKKWEYFIPLLFLFLSFGFSRAFSILSLSAWKKSFRK